MTLDDIVQAVRTAHDSHTPLRIRGAGSKDFYGGVLSGEVLDVAGYRGIVAYEPTELYITARCGTPLADLEAALAEKGQMFLRGECWLRWCYGWRLCRGRPVRATPAAGGGGARLRARREAG